ncbi:MAG: helix-hairpin-helix domain-containing protein [Candidatus Baltobacteraceae bacterium]
MPNARYLLMGLLATAAGAAVLRGPAPKAVVTVQTSAPQTSRKKPSVKPKNILVFVAGAVNKPGLYTLAEGTRAFEAVAKAGGLRADADPAGVDLAAPLSDGEEIAAPLLGTRRNAAHGIRNAPHRAKSRKKKTSIATVEAIDLNAADASALAQLPGIGEELARRVVAFRQANGDFMSLDELADVAGMSQSRIDGVTPYLFVNH